MNRIRLLPENVANQIAAGEVVERPASVVKELVENSLDAEATRVTVEIQAGGRSLIRVTDDGVGMSRDDALLCLERHATSKIRRAEDLSAVTTMGFRGEAVPSIASVSRFSLTTRERDSESPEGTQIIISGGKIQEVKAAGSATGTIIEVRQLFFNLPARRKFLRTEETEAAHIQHYLTLAALAYPATAFTFHKDGRMAWQLPSVRSGEDVAARLGALRERMRALYGGESSLLAVDFSAPLPGAVEEEETIDFESASPTPPSPADIPPAPMFRVWGFIGAPGVSRSSRQDQHVFVNRRPVENRGINFALTEGYHTSLMKGRYPVACLFLELDPAAVDVNIHPAKREVKFHKEADIRRLVAQAVRQTLLKFHGTTAEMQPKAVSRPQTPAPRQTELSAPGIPAVQTRQEPTATAAPPIAAPKAQPPFTPPASAPLRPAAPPVSNEPSPARQSELIAHPAAAPTTSNTNAPLLSVPLRLVGVIGKLYVVLESDRGLVLMDQHAAHERILFERMLNQLEKPGQAPSQRLLLPATVELSVRDATFLRDQLAGLTRLGVGLSEFGERTFLLDALPPYVKAPDPRRFVLELVDELKSVGKEINTIRLGEHVVAKTVCRHAVKANDPLGGRELENLVEDLRRCAMPYTCPHGRPTLIEMSMRELEKKFGRIQ